MIIREYKNWAKGLINSIEAKSIPAGSLSAVLNWQPVGDKIELRRGMHLIGTEVSGSGRISGLHAAQQFDGTQVLVRSRGRKIEYYDETTEDWIEIGTDTLPAAADGEDVAFGNYYSLAGAQLWFSSPNSGLYKILTANMGSVLDCYSAAVNFKGYIRIGQNRMFSWYRPADKSSVRGSTIDTLTFTTVTDEALASVASGTLAAVSGTRTVFAVSITVTTGGEVFTDNYDGTLTGSAGHTGTINYITGAFTTTATGAGTATYQWEDSNADGISDFRESSPRVAAEGFSFKQGDAGTIMNVLPYKDTEYCLHEKKAYALTLSADDTKATNLIYRDRVGIPNWRAAYPTGNGIWYLDDTDETGPAIRLLAYDVYGNQVIPISKSLNLDLTDYLFDKAAIIEYGDYILVSCRTSDSAHNNRVFVYDKTWDAWTQLDWWVSCWAIYNGTLVAGNSISNNCYEVFSGLDDDDSLINNSVETWETDLEIQGLKKVKKIVAQGEIGPDQSCDVYVNLDNGDYTKIGTIEGDGNYVDKGQSVSVGALTLGRSEIGGGGTQGEIPAYNYVREITWRSDKFERCKLKFVATGIGYFSVSGIKFYDCRYKGKRTPSKYR